jgi:hypothetical protein
MIELIEHIKQLNAKSRAWVAADPANRFAGLLSEDAAHWRGYGVTDVASLEHYLLAIDVYEATKDVWGYKPNWSVLKAMTYSELQSEWAKLLGAMRAE